MPATPMSEPAPMDIAINVALNKYCGIESAAFALAVIRPDGQISTFLSDDLKTEPNLLFTPEFQNELLMASGREPLHHKMLNREFSAEGTGVQNQTCNNARTITIGDDTARNKVYRLCLIKLQQNGCKIIGKAWVKLLEPKKQSTYPYTKGAQKRPPWWPAGTGPNSVRHKEPDHLHKRERIILLMHIIGLVVSQDRNSPAQQRKVGVAKLEEVTREAMATWFAEKPQNAKKRSFVTQIFRVLHKEERYRRGELDGSTTVCVNDDGVLDDEDDDDADDEDEGSDISPQLYQTQPISPFHPTPPSSLSPSHTITSTTTSANYYPHFLPLPAPPTLLPETTTTAP
ncbi:hypothetical protein ACLOAV_008332 [Pseudogymnoascus australis]